MHISIVSFPANLQQRLSGRENFESIIRKAILDEMERETGIQKRMFARTTRTWNHEVVFDSDIVDSGDEITVHVYTDDMIYYFIDNGTSIRYATMTPDFEPKSTPRVIGSKHGQGGLAFVNKRWPKPGIEAREFTTEIFNRRNKYFYKNMDRRITREINKYMKGLFDG